MSSLDVCKQNLLIEVCKPKQNKETIQFGLVRKQKEIDTRDRKHLPIIFPTVTALSQRHSVNSETLRLAQICHPGDLGCRTIHCSKS